MDATEIIRQLEGDPGLRAQMRAVLLGDELLELPDLVRQLIRAQERTERRIHELQDAMEQRFVALEGRVEHHDARFDQVDARLDRMEARFDQVDVPLDRVDARFDQVDARLDQVDARLDRVDARFEQVDARFDQVDARLDRVDARFEQVDARFDQVEGRLGAIEADLGDLKGRSIEDRVRSDPRRYVPSRISRRVRVVAPDEVEEILGRLDLDEADGLSRADALIRATLPDGTEVVFVVEASWNAHGDDIERAVQRAALARRAGLEAAPMVISQRVPHDSVLGRARELGVVVVAEPTGLLVPGR